MKRFICIFLLFTITICWADDKQKIFQEANQLYETGNYSEALLNYKELLSCGIRDGNLYYNIGNSYFKNRQIGMARLFYEKSFRLLGRDEDVRFNLNFTRTLVKEKPTDIFEMLFGLLNTNELTGITEIFYIAFSVLLVLAIFRKIKFLSLLNLTVAFFFIFFSGWFFTKVYYEEIKKSGVVVNSEVSGLSGPGDDYSVGFTLPEGTKIIILNEKDDWYEVGIKKEGLKGWVKKSSIEKI